MNGPWLAALAFLPVLLALLAISAFFSASEAALFSLPGSHRRKLSRSRPGERLTLELLDNPNRLLTSILFCNLTVNMAFFAVASIAAEKLSESEGNSTWGAVFTFASLFVVILGGELIPKSIGVLSPILVSRLVSLPLTICLRVLDPVTTFLRLVNEGTRRLIWPGLKPENYLEITDLERAIALSTNDAQLIEQEQSVLQNVLQLSEIRVEEWMRPRSEFPILNAPITMRDLVSNQVTSDYLLVNNAAGKEIIGAINLRTLAWREASDLANQYQQVLFVPWCATVSTTLERFLREERRVAIIVDEYGEMIGVLTQEDALEAAFDLQHKATDRALAQPNIQRISEFQWNVTGTTSLRRLERALGKKLPPRSSLTIAGVLQEQLHRLPVPGDLCTWEWVGLEVLQSPRRGEMLVQIQVGEPPEARP